MLQRRALLAQLRTQHARSRSAHAHAARTLTQRARSRSAHAHAARTLTQRARSRCALVAHAVRVAGPDVDQMSPQRPCSTLSGGSLLSNLTRNQTPSFIISFSFAPDTEPHSHSHSVWTFSQKRAMNEARTVLMSDEMMRISRLRRRRRRLAGRNSGDERCPACWHLLSCRADRDGQPASVPLGPVGAPRHEAAQGRRQGQLLAGRDAALRPQSSSIALSCRA